LIFDGLTTINHHNKKKKKKRGKKGRKQSTFHHQTSLICTLAISNQNYGVLTVKMWSMRLIVS